MFKECLCHGTMSVIIDDKRRPRHHRNIKEWHEYSYEFINVVVEDQERFETQIELQRLYDAAGQFFVPATYQEGFDNEFDNEDA